MTTITVQSPTVVVDPAQLYGEPLSEKLIRL